MKRNGWLPQSKDYDMNYAIFDYKGKSVWALVLRKNKNGTCRVKISNNWKETVQPEQVVDKEGLQQWLNRDLVVQTLHFSGDKQNDLNQEQQWEAYCLCDGFGQLPPVQLNDIGWDWSHVRDSSPKGFARVRKFIEKCVAENGGEQCEVCCIHEDDIHASGDVVELDEDGRCENCKHADLV